MDLPKDGPSPKQTYDQGTSRAGKKNEHWDLGPDLKPIPFLTRVISILIYAIKNYKIQIGIMGLALIFLGVAILILNWNVLLIPIHPKNTAAMPPISPSNWADWWMRVQSFLGMGTLLVALFVWYSRIRDNWEDHLPKRMSVFFLHNGLPVIACRYIWLASDGDLRAWGQQVAAQAVGGENLRFYPNVRAEAPRDAMWIDGNICRHYELCFELMDMDKKKKQNLFLAKYAGMCRYQNMATGSNIVSSVPIADLKNRIKAEVFSFNWQEKSNPNHLSDTVIQTQLTLYRYLPNNE